MQHQSQNIIKAGSLFCFIVAMVLAKIRKEKSFMKPNIRLMKPQKTQTPHVRLTGDSNWL